MSSDGDMVEVMVTDQCGGIPDEDLDRVFDVAWRGSTARTPEPGSPTTGGDSAWPSCGASSRRTGVRST